jgi:hypothetical protein
MLVPMINYQPIVSRDMTVISLKEPTDAEFWCRRFGVDESELRLAIRHAGDGAEAVEKVLSRPLAQPHWGEHWNDSASLSSRASPSRNTPAAEKFQHPRLRARKSASNF